MSDFNSHDFDKILNNIKYKIGSVAECDSVRSIESNLDTKGMMFKSKSNPIKNGMLIIGEDKGSIAVDISIDDNSSVRSFILKNKYDTDGVNNIVKWFERN
ncbi:MULTISPECIES: hypothetical protein [Clostridium]|jgi:hypothetical protein|uniref:hypothetical protein n=1 Tax=Clostridium TaxID=1485 RepID=UPI000289E30F|nr:MULTISPECIES: hypothetical protein [Clostridium]MDF2504289.1 hypothetical protein [Clostridium sp.]